MVEKCILNINKIKVSKYIRENFWHYFFYNGNKIYEWTINKKNNKFIVLRLDGKFDKTVLEEYHFDNYEKAEKFVLDKIEKITSEINSGDKNGQN